MARLFDDASSEYLENTVGAPVSGVPLTLAAWFYCDDTASWNDRCLISVEDKDSTSNYFELGLRTGDEETVRAYTRDNGNHVYAKTTAQFGVNTWYHAAAVYSAVDARAAFLSGGNKGTESTSVTPANLDAISVGRLGDLSPGHYATGGIAEVGIWNTALTDAEVAILAAGYSPLFVQPAHLAAYYAEVANDDDWLGGFDLTAFNTPSWMVHPSGIVYPEKPMLMIY